MNHLIQWNLQSMHKTALNMADKKIGDVDVAEVHDAFSVCEPMALEAIGAADLGKGSALVKTMKQKISKINPRGGLIGCGHPLGATGIAQTIEITQQLQNNAEKRQVENANVILFTTCLQQQHHQLFWY